ncbi:hypothetical protein UA42_00120 [Photobacterium kishitanii]|uniref:hypothetical protein n=1 Tax=Photobacterium kishitanii TaxID=318456 RepID=UPI0005D30F4C|nr:hypothetical protein [Photobacterium kishitanii]KJG62866.1 hypothetical protein UA42_00120 [Photobacterium kishitanii]KJG68771.1 hypothetical protein UA41_15135 [Photobacterium kishitanii]
MYYIELKNTELLLKQHLAHFEYISFNCNNDNPFIVFLNTNRNNILIGSPTKHLEIINDLYQCILTETQTVPLSEYCDFNTMKIIQIMRNNETKNIIDIQFELVWPMPLKILRNKILKKIE